MYGISAAGFAEIVQAQDGKCGSCGETKKRLVVDHDHETGEIRGALCQSCNFGIGLLGDDEASILRALDYFRKRKSPK